VSTPATNPQLDYLLMLANKLNGGTSFRYLSQVRDILGLSSFQLQRGITKAQASALIDDLKRRLAGQEEQS